MGRDQGLHWPPCLPVELPPRMSLSRSRTSMFAFTLAEVRKQIQTLGATAQREQSKDWIRICLFQKRFREILPKHPTPPLKCLLLLFKLLGTHPSRSNLLLAAPPQPPAEAGADPAPCTCGEQAHRCPLLLEWLTAPVPSPLLPECNHTPPRREGATQLGTLSGLPPPEPGLCQGQAAGLRAGAREGQLLLGATLPWNTTW